MNGAATSYWCVLRSGATNQCKMSQFVVSLTLTFKFNLFFSPKAPCNCAVHGKNLPLYLGVVAIPLFPGDMCKPRLFSLQNKNGGVQLPH